MKKLVFALVLLSLSCSKSSNNDNNTNNTDPDMAEDATSDVTSEEDGGADATIDDGSEDLGDDSGADMNMVESCANAEPFVGETGMGVIDAPGVRRFFSVVVTEGTWYQLSAGADAFDPVVIIRDEIGQQLATNDDFTPGFTQASVFYRAPSDGTLCLEVVEKGDFLGENPAGGPTFEFAVLAKPTNDDGDGINVDTEPNDGPQTAQPSEIFANGMGDASALFLGLFEAAQSRDMYQLTPTTTGNVLNLEFLQQGTDGHGATDELGIVNIYGGDVGTLIASFDGANAPAMITVPIPEVNGIPVTLFIEVIAPDAIGSNPAYALVGRFAPNSNQTEANEGANDLFATPEVATGNPHYIQGEIPAGDIDHWSFQVTTGDTVRLFCSSRRDGMGALGVDFAILDQNGTVLQNEVEVETANIAWTIGGSLAPVTAVNDGVHVLRVTGGADDPNVITKNYRCGIFVE